MTAVPAGDLLVRRAGRVVTNAGPPIAGPVAVGIRGGVLAWVGPDATVPRALTDAPELDAAGACVIPGFVDPHTHAVWAGSRREEFVARLDGTRYDGGGIAGTVAATAGRRPTTSWWTSPPGGCWRWRPTAPPRSS